MSMPQPHDPHDRTGPRLAVLLALGSLVLLAVAGGVGQARDAERAGVTAVDAVVLDAGPATAADGGAAPARVAWRATDGRTAVATVAVGPDRRTGDAVRLWTSPDGSVAAPPAGSGSAVAVVLVLLTGTGVAAMVLAAHRAARGRARSRDLAREWALVEPGWSGRGTPDRTEP